MPMRFRVLAVLVAVWAGATLLTGSAHADEPIEPSFPAESHDTELLHLDAWQPPAFEQARAPRTCPELAAATASEARLVLTDAQLDGGPGSRLCILWDLEWENYIAIVLNHRSVDEWRATKLRLQPLLAGAGIDPCLVAFWSSVDAPTQRSMVAADRHDAGRACEPRLVAHGPTSEARRAEIRSAFDDSAAWGAFVFGWPLTWPLQVHAYDDHKAFVEGVWIDAGNDDASPRSLASTRGIAGVLANGMRGFLLDLSGFRDQASLRMLIAHEYAHIAQAGAMGCTCNAPFWAIEGGAEYFASLVVGPAEKNLADRFAAAVGDEYAKRVTKLTSLTRPPSGNQRTAPAAYSRGYAAFRFLAATHGEESFGRLHRESPMGSIDRWLAALTAVTGLTVGEFDTRLSAWLFEQAATLPRPPLRPETRLEPNSQLVQLTTGRPLGDDVQVTTAFTGDDVEIAVVLEWQCIATTVSAEVALIQPDGRRYATSRARFGPGCRLPGGFVLGLDQGPAGRTIRSLPGAWRAEVHVGGVLQGTTTFIVR